MKSAFIISFLLLLATRSYAEIAVITHPSNANALTESHIAHIFLGKTKTFPDGATAIPINQPEDSATSVAFTQNALSKTPSQLKAYWSKLLFTGQGQPPKQVNSDADVIKLVAENPNTIGYIDAANVTAQVKVAGKF